MRPITDHELKIINKTAKSLAPFFVFSYYDKEDIEQEIRLLCIQILDNYDETKSDLYTYLFMAARHSIINMQRTKLSRTIAYCNTCEYNKEGECTKHTDRAECRQYNIRVKNNIKKWNLANPSVLDDENFSFECDYGAELDGRVIYNVVDSEIPAKLRRDYLTYLDGGYLPYYNKKLVVTKIREIAVNHKFVDKDDVVWED